MIKKIAFGLSCLVLVMLASCKKEEREVQQSPSSSERLIPPVHCSPYRVVLGSALMAELTTLANCELTYQCTPNTTTTIQSPRFINPADNSFYGFQDAASISTADQLTILQMGKNYATANLPAGYIILRIEFKADYVTNPHAPAGLFNVYVTVTYRKCL